jgi:hypothetical protein
MATAGYSETPLVKKLGIKPGFKLCIIDSPENYWALLGELPSNVHIRELGAGPFDFIHIFVKDKARLEAWMGALKERMLPSGMIWVSWPKKSSKVATDLNENSVRDIALQSGLVDTKVAAVDDTWSGLKLVIRLRDRS